jgi:probable rRNA maturation factor
MPRVARAAIRIDVLVESDLWTDPGKIKLILRRAVREAANALPTRGGEVAIVLTDDSAVRRLNRQWRGFDKATNVLSFPAKEASGKPPVVGDIVLAHETIAREAHRDGKPFSHHLAHLTVHGFLHLNGYDHQRTEDADEMEDLERKILRRLGIPDPYRPRTKAPPRKAAKLRAGTR